MQPSVKLLGPLVTIIIKDKKDKIHVLESLQMDAVTEQISFAYSKSGCFTHWIPFILAHEQFQSTDKNCTAPTPAWQNHPLAANMKSGANKNPS